MTPAPRGGLVVHIIENVGNPEPTSTSTRTSGAFMPCGVRLSVVASVMCTSGNRCVSIAGLTKQRSTRYRHEFETIEVL
jgi:hypothetical protein